MKYCLSVNKDMEMKGYTTVFIQTRMVGFDQINHKIEDASATEIIAEDVLSHFEFDKQESILHLMAKKIRKGGSLVVSFSDIDVLLETLSQDNSVGSINAILFGGGEPAIKSVSDSSLVCQALEQAGLKILNVRYDAHRAIVKAVRP